MTPGDAATGTTLAAQTDAVAAACRVLVGISVQSMAAVEDEVTPNQLRVLMILASRGPSSISELAEAMGVHLSNASRTCDRLAATGMLHRTTDPADRRQVVLEVSAQGRAVVRKVVSRRRTAIRNVLRRMPEPARDPLVDALEQFATAGGEPTAPLWTLGWADD